MKRFLKIIGIILLLIIILFLTLALVQPKDVKIERSTVINAPVAAVREQIYKFKNWPNWSPWVAKEPNVQLTYSGTDGETGSAYHWVGKKTGEGEMTNKGIAGDIMSFDLRFIKPWKGHSEGSFRLEDAGSGKTKVTWIMNLHASFPKNAFNFMSDKMIGDDFDKGLDKMKQYVESHPFDPTASVKVETVSFEPHTYAQIRKVMSWDAMNAFMKDKYPAIQAAAGPRISGVPAAIYYTWNEQEHTTDVGVVVPVKGKEPVKGTEIIEVPQSSGYKVTYTGGYSGMMPVHKALGAKVDAAGKKPSMVLEEYVKGPFNEPDSNKWVTNVYYLVP